MARLACLAVALRGTEASPGRVAVADAVKRCLDLRDELDVQRRGWVRCTLAQRCWKVGIYEIAGNALTLDQPLAEVEEQNEGKAACPY